MLMDKDEYKKLSTQQALEWLEQQKADVVVDAVEKAVATLKDGWRQQLAEMAGELFAQMREEARFYIDFVQGGTVTASVWFFGDHDDERKLFDLAEVFERECLQCNASYLELQSVDATLAKMAAAREKLLSRVMTEGGEIDGQIVKGIPPMEVGE
jgi:hypothetical protein